MWGGNVLSQQGPSSHTLKILALQRLRSPLALEIHCALRLLNGEGQHHQHAPRLPEQQFLQPVERKGGLEEGGIYRCFQAVQESVRRRGQGLGVQFLEILVGVQRSQHLRSPFQIEDGVQHPQAGNGGSVGVLGGVFLGMVVLQDKDPVLCDDLQEIVELLVVYACVRLHQHLWRREKKVVNVSSYAEWKGA